MVLHGALQDGLCGREHGCHMDALKNGRSLSGRQQSCHMDALALFVDYDMAATWTHGRHMAALQNGRTLHGRWHGCHVDALQKLRVFVEVNMVATQTRRKHGGTLCGPLLSEGPLGSLRASLNSKQPSRRAPHFSHCCSSAVRVLSHASRARLEASVHSSLDLKHSTGREH